MEAFHLIGGDKIQYLLSMYRTVNYIPFPFRHERLQGVLVLNAPFVSEGAERVWRSIE